MSRRSRALHAALVAALVGLSFVAPARALEVGQKANPIRYLLLSDFRRQMLPQYDAMVTNEQSPIFRYAKRAYFIIDKNGVLKWMKVMDNPLDLLNPDDVLKVLKELGA